MDLDSTQFFNNVKGSSVVTLSPSVELNYGTFVSFQNKSGNKFTVQVIEINNFIHLLYERNDEIAKAIISHELHSSPSPWVYQEKPYRSLTAEFFTLDRFPAINPLIGSQTAGVYNAISSYIAFILNHSITEGPLLFDKSTLKLAIEVLDRHAASFARIEVPEKLSQVSWGLPLGPFDSVKKAALESLHYCFEHNQEAFVNAVDINEYKAAPKGRGIYLWISRRGLDEGNADTRVFTDRPFLFNGSEYFLSDQWTIDSEKGRSLEVLNRFLMLFKCRVVEQNQAFVLVCTAAPVTPLPLPKPFLLLAGISGTGKTRFVREQAKASAVLFGIAERSNYCLIPVRPDWHEPSDLLGYISRIGGKGARYVVTDVLCFMVAAWKHSTLSADDRQIVLKDYDCVSPFWLCLDEMNLAPVEQYFADYLSILETRKWVDGVYSCDSLLKPAVINQHLDDEGRSELWEKLGIAETTPLCSGLRDHFSKWGIPIPPNLIVAGTVNMDETTHGFSRKVIDRALTVDFGEFFPNDFAQYYSSDRKVADLPLNFPRLSLVQKESDLCEAVADPDGRRTIGFLAIVNGVLAGTPFALAYRALNEILLCVASFKPADDTDLQAVWDDFLMMKVLPRVEGDSEKLCFDGNESLLTRLQDVLKEQLPAIWLAAVRPDLFRKALSGPDEPVECRSRGKLEWMQKRLAESGFTSFWP